jgi:hypothetical protein
MQEKNENSKIIKIKEEVNLNRLFCGVLKNFTLPLESVSVGNYTRNKVGEAGEDMFYEYVKLILDPSVTEIIWMNKKSESGEPYDFIIKIGLTTIYLDVKATKGPYSNDVYMSNRELEFSKKIPNYYIARLYEWETDRGRLRAGNFNVKVQPFVELEHLIKIS